MGAESNVDGNGNLAGSDDFDSEDEDDDGANIDIDVEDMDSDDSDSEIEGEQPTAADLENDYQDDNYPSDSEDDDVDDDDEDNEDDEDDDDSDDEVAGEIPIPTSALLGPPIESDSEDAAEDYEPAGQPGSDAEPKDYEDGIDE